MPARCLLGFLVAVLASPHVRTQEPGLAEVGSELRRVQDALLRGEPGVARDLLAALHLSSEPALAPAVALLEVQLAQPHDRLGGYLALTAAFPEAPEALSAWIAGLHILVTRFGLELPEEAKAGFQAEGETFLKKAAIEVARILERSPKDERALHARGLLHLARSHASDSLARPLCLAPTTEIPLPRPLAEAVEARWTRIDGDDKGWQRVRRGDMAPHATAEVDADSVSLIAPKQPGLYAVEIRSPSRGFSEWRLIQVSDLEIVAQTTGKGALVLALLGGQPKEGVLVRASNHEGRESTGRTGSDGLAFLPFKPIAGRWIKVSARTSDGHQATCDETLRPEPVRNGIDYSGHLFVDRPLYRPGEKLRGRIAVVTHALGAPIEAIDGPSAALETSAAKNLAIVLNCNLPNGEHRSQELVTDDAGVAEFEIGIPSTSDHGRISLEAFAFVSDPSEYVRTEPREGGKFRIVIASANSASVADFVRPPLLVDVASQATWTPSEPDPKVRVSVTLPSGVPAALSEGTFSWTLGAITQRTPFVLDVEGRFSVSAALTGLDFEPGEHTLAYTVQLQSADGQTIRRSGRILVRIPGPKVSRPDEPRSTGAFASVPLRVGSPARAEVTGTPNETMLVTVVGASLVEARVVTLDSQGKASVEFPCTEAWWPGVRLCINGTAKSEVPNRRFSSRRPMEAVTAVEHPSERLKIAVAWDRERYLPGQEAELEILTTSSSGAETASSVAISVVDESLFLLSEDRTRSPLDSLRANAARVAGTGWIASRRTSDLWQVFGRLFQNGKIRNPLDRDGHFSLGAAGGGAGSGAFGGRAGGGGESGLRSDFRATAFFEANLRTGPDGKAKVRFRFPDDLTTWRVTLVASTARGGAALEKAHITTVKPLAVELTLPRILRQGDLLLASARIVQQQGESPSGLRLRTSGTEELSAALPEGDASVQSVPGAFAEARFPIHSSAAKATEGRVSAVLWKADTEEIVDQCERKLSLHDSMTRREEATALLVNGSATVEIPRKHPGTIERILVEVLGSTDAALRDAASYLGAYPHECAEQTASRLTPVLLAAQAMIGLEGQDSAEGRPSKVLTPEQSLRLDLGLARLRELQNPDGGFAWWRSGDSSDPEMSAQVWRLFALAKDAGIDLAGHRIAVQPTLAILSAARDSILGSAESKAHEPFPAEALTLLSEEKPAKATIRNRQRAYAAADLVITASEIFRDSEHLADSLQKIAGTAGLPLGMRARAARALALTGHVPSARSLADELLSRPLDSFESSSVPVLAEGSSSRLAALLELITVLKLETPRRAEILAGLLRRSRAGLFDTTAGSAAVLTALARDRALQKPAPALGDFEILLDGDFAPKVLRLSAKNAWSARTELPVDTRSFQVRSRAGTPLTFVTTTTHLEEGATARAVTDGLKLSRRLVALGSKSAGARKEGETTEGLREGTPTEVRFVVEGPPEASYLVLECPIPAGFEVVPGSSGWMVRDDRASLGINALGPDGRFEAAIRFIPAYSGRVSWPPATCEPMYEPGSFARTNGASLSIEPKGVESPTAPEATFFTKDVVEQHFADTLASLRKEETDADLARIVVGAARMPLQGWRSFVREGLPRHLGTKLLFPEVLRHFVDCHGTAWFERCRGASLEALLTAIGGNRSAALSKLAATIPVDRAIGACLDSRIPADENRLLALAILARMGESRDKDDVARARALVHVLDSDKALADPEVLKERCDVLFSGSPHEQALAALERSFTALHGALCTRSGIAHGMDHEPARLAALRELILSSERFLRRLDAAHRGRFAQTLDRMASTVLWPAEGAMQPDWHKDLGALVQGLRDRAWTWAAPMLLPPSPVAPALNGLFELATNGRAATDRMEATLLILPHLTRVASGLLEDEMTSSIRELGTTVLETLESLPFDARFEPHLFALACCQHPDWAEEAINVLPTKAQDSIPTSVLMRKLGLRATGSVAAAEILRRRGKEVVLACLMRGSGVYAPARASLLVDADPKDIATLPLPTLIALSDELHPGDKEEAAAIETLHLALRDRRPAASELVSIFQKEKSLGIRSFLIRALAETGVESLSEGPSDDAGLGAYALLLSAHSGDAAAANRIKSWIHDDSIPSEVRSLVEWALGPRCTPVDAISWKFSRKVLEASVKRARPYEMRALLDIPINESRNEVEFAFGCLSEALAKELLAFASERWKTDERAVRIFSRAPLADAIAVLGDLKRLPTPSAQALLQVVEGSPDFQTQMAGLLLEHPAEKVREEAAETIHGLTHRPVSYRSDNGEAIRKRFEDREGALEAFRENARLRTAGKLGTETKTLPQLLERDPVELWIALAELGLAVGQ